MRLRERPADLRIGGRMKWRWIPLWLALAMPLVCFADEGIDGVVDCGEAYAAIPEGSILDLLDPDAPDDRRALALEHYQRLSTIKSCPEFGYTLGQLYRHGPDLPGNPLPRDIPKAHELIRAMAEAGYLPAYADLAEMVMRHGDPREAMKWTQVYLYFVRTVQPPLMNPGKAQFHRSAYNGHLLNRAEVVWTWQKPAVPRKRVVEDLNEYLGQHGTRVARLMRERLQGQHGSAASQEGRFPRVLKGADDCRITPIDRIGAATVSWIVEVLPSGEMGRVVLENFVPKAAVADKLGQCLQMFEFEAFDGTRPATVRIPLMYGSPEGASFRR